MGGGDLVGRLEGGGGPEVGGCMGGPPLSVGGAWGGLAVTGLGGGATPVGRMVSTVSLAPCRICTAVLGSMMRITTWREEGKVRLGSS